MRKLLTVLLVLFGCLTFVGQAVAGAAGYDDCCLHGCKGMTQCASAACHTCAAPQQAPLPDRPAAPAPDGRHWHESAAPFDTGPRRKPWTPPD
ncbi:MAG: hypothetical protein HY020_19400 [Burkholderiales bacterium]|nr:hypothetical protein [Burkholderiales bacterium]